MLFRSGCKLVSADYSQIELRIMAHIAEHLAFKYRRQVEEQLGVPLFPPNEELPEDVEVWHGFFDEYEVLDLDKIKEYV